MLTDKKIVVGVTGGIAAYKAAELVRQLIQAGCGVRVMMTAAAAEFVTPLTFETLTHHPVLVQLFPGDQGGGTVHIEWARWADLFVLCPASANTVAKLAHGLADNALTTTLLATTAPILLCPAMNKQMYANPFYRD
ncbi:MAG TPA: flavoprotein, partial [bacterium]|nr:flavoprotein [bacterium]